MGQPRGRPLSYPSLFAMATSCCHPFSAISPLTDAYGFAPIPRHYVQSIPHLFDRSSMAKQNFSHCANVICNGSPSRIRIVRRISLGITTLPRSSMRLTIPVAFISLVLRIFVVQSLFSAIEQKLCRKKICVFFISIPLQKLFRRRSLHLHRQRDHRHRRRLGI